MCGIAGYWGPQEANNTRQETLQRMVQALRHRGPDSHGLWTPPHGGPALGHARLSIVDLSDAGHQPMLSPDSRLCITYNGEIYNFMQLRQELDESGHTPSGGWRGHCDTEVILASIQAWGLHAALQRFVGMFAFALWDDSRQSLTLVRDRLGIKPLYCGFCGPSFLFASELKALKQHPAWQGDVHAEALARYLGLAYVPAPLSIYAGIYKLQPGTLLTLQQEDLQARRMPQATSYWSVAAAIAEGLADPLTEPPDLLADRLEAQLLDAVRLRMVADVPLGAMLSGGVDSSTVTALMQELNSRPVKTFSIGSQNKDYNEAPAAKQIAAYLGTEHCELVVEARQALDVLPQMPFFYDEPYADASQIPTFLVSRLARQQVTVCLTGDGGDELFAGYNRHFHAPRLWQRLQAVPLPLRRQTARLLRGYGERFLARGHAGISALRGRQTTPLVRDKLQKIVEAMDSSSREDFYESLIAAWQQEHSLLQATPATDDPVEALLTARQSPPDLDYVSWMMFRDQTGYLPDDILTKLDRASMAVSLEGRVPLLDHRVVELAWRMPAAARIAGGQGKQILRRVLYRRVPRELVERPKQGFSVPVDEWLRRELRPWAEELLAPPRLEEGGLRPEPVRRAWKEHLDGRRNHPWPLWTVLMYQAWRQENL